MQSAEVLARVSKLKKAAMFPVEKLPVLDKLYSGMSYSSLGMTSVLMNRKYMYLGASLVVLWLRLCIPNVESTGLIPGQRSRSHISQLKPSTAK